ncbi:MAG: hypothetical protein HYT07_03245 [Candidatus Levybacteria bacterium]|nr:hypothetical protein [Candidatus Levybacteria bacterium]
MTSPERRTFINVEPSEEVKRFLTENPNARWDQCLGYVLDHWPQVRDGKIDYLVEGGTALRLLFPQRQDPADVDILTRSQQMNKHFRNSRKFDVKHITDWYASRLHPYNSNAFDQEGGNFLFDMNQSVEFGNRKVLVLNSLGLAVSKTLRYLHRDLRKKDLRDLTLLNQDSTQIRQIIKKIKTIYPQP